MKARRTWQPGQLFRRPPQEVTFPLYTVRRENDMHILDQSLGAIQPYWISINEALLFVGFHDVSYTDGVVTYYKIPIFFVGDQLRAYFGLHNRLERIQEDGDA